MRPVAAVPALLLLVGCSGDVTIDDAWVRAAPPGVSMTAGYLTLHNPDARAITVVGASSDSHAQAMLHETRVEDGTSRMRHLDELRVSGKSDVAFEPGGRHLMLMAPTRELAEGDVVKLTLYFADDSAITVDAAVRRDR